MEVVERESLLAEASSSSTYFALLDACDEPQIQGLVEPANPRVAHLCSLYKGTAATDFWAIAPYLYSLDRDRADWLLGNLTTEAWGYVVKASCDLEKLAMHFRRHTYALDPEGCQVLFRYYDPRVIASVLPTLSAADFKQFVGPCEVLLLPGADGTFVKYTLHSA